WMPHRFAALSDRLTTQNGILLMSIASWTALLYTGGDVRHIVVMYSINVFLTFSLSMLGMAISWYRSRRDRAHWRRRTSLFVVGFTLCATILVITIVEKFREGGWITLAGTGTLVGTCFLIPRPYRPTPPPRRSPPQALGRARGHSRPPPRPPGRAGSEPADRRRAGRRLRRPRHPHHPQHLPRLPGALPEPGLPVRRRHRLGGLQGRGLDRGAAGAHRGDGRALRRARPRPGRAGRLAGRNRHRRGRGGRCALRRGRARVQANHLLRGQGDLPARALVPADPPQRDRLRDPEAPAMGRPDHGDHPGAGSLTTFRTDPKRRRATGGIAAWRASLLRGLGRPT